MVGNNILKMGASIVVTNRKARLAALMVVGFVVLGVLAVDPTLADNAGPHAPTGSVPTAGGGWAPYVPGFPDPRA